VTEYLTEEEKVEDIKEWWRENGRSVIAGIVIGAGGIFGWRFWGDYQEGQSEAASLAYADLREQMQAGAYEGARTAAATIVDEYARTPYAALAALEAAHAAVEQGDAQAAVERLEWVRAQARQESLRELASLRLARLLTAIERYDEAEAILDAGLPEAYAALEAEARGDIHRARGELEQAREAYERALALPGAPVEYLQMKRDDLGLPEPAQ
jgi:predicted negative regulator of RcsB-dependent stress response